MARGRAVRVRLFMMIVGVYATLGVFLILASRDPAANRSLIQFTIVSSLVHAAIMAVQSFQMPSTWATSMATCRG